MSGAARDGRAAGGASPLVVVRCRRGRSVSRSLARSRGGTPRSRSAARSVPSSRGTCRGGRRPGGPAPDGGRRPRHTRPPRAFPGDTSLYKRPEPEGTVTARRPRRDRKQETPVSPLPPPPVAEHHLAPRTTTPSVHCALRAAPCAARPARGVLGNVVRMGRVARGMPGRRRQALVLPRAQPALPGRAPSREIPRFSSFLLYFPSLFPFSVRVTPL